ncbi:hypothetical protein Pan216_33990 [Planctomycetes bacterium Pan216]|uniref:Uncharacterized protein n=1 Tax=Kolteria novifilia TaxID=2527975 RepID=A0A518B6G9_9BACT|nr:hypothetical protein Pan216_33990 [Planctomycetes bacterium Pan216]
MLLKNTLPFWACCLGGLIFLSATEAQAQDADFNPTTEALRQVNRTKLGVQEFGRQLLLIDSDPSDFSPLEKSAYLETVAKQYAGAARASVQAAEEQQFEPDSIVFAPPAPTAVLAQLGFPVTGLQQRFSGNANAEASAAAGTGARLSTVGIVARALVAVAAVAGSSSDGEPVSTEFSVDSDGNSVVSPNGSGLNFARSRF